MTNFDLGFTPFSSPRLAVMPDGTQHTVLGFRANKGGPNEGYHYVADTGLRIPAEGVKIHTLEPVDLIEDLGSYIAELMLRAEGGK